MEGVVQQRQDEHAEREKDFGPARAIPRECFCTKEALKDVLAQSRQQPVSHFQHVVDDV